MAYYSGYRVIDLTGLADKSWRDGDREARLHLLANSDAWVTENVRGRQSSAFCQFGSLLREAGFSLRAIVLQPGNVQGYYQEVFLRAGASLPDTIGDEVTFGSSKALHDGAPITIYRVNNLTHLSDSEVVEMIRSSGQCP